MGRCEAYGYEVGMKNILLVWEQEAYAYEVGMHVTVKSGWMYKQTGNGVAGWTCASRLKMAECTEKWWHNMHWEENM